MTHLERASETTTSADRVETAQRMVRALAYLMRVSSAAGLPRVTAKLALAQAELLLGSGQALIETEPGKARHDGSHFEGSQRPH